MSAKTRKSEPRNECDSAKLLNWLGTPSELNQAPTDDKSTSLTKPEHHHGLHKAVNMAALI